MSISTLTAVSVSAPALLAGKGHHPISLMSFSQMIATRVTRRGTRTRNHFTRKANSERSPMTARANAGSMSARTFAGPSSERGWGEAWGSFCLVVRLRTGGGLIKGYMKDRQDRQTMLAAHG